MANKLADLPPSVNKYWKHSDVHIKRMEEQKDCNHFFKAKAKAGEVECKYCNVGFYLNGQELIDGHIYSDGTLII